jgi:DNA-directed RNA polymerase subunit RPC12/RpoP
MNKLNIMLEDETNILYKCSYCSKLFTQKQQDKFGCQKAKIFIDFHGKVIANHMFDRTFDVKKFINYCKTNMKFSWKQIYWKVYSHTQDFQCKT